MPISIFLILLGKGANIWDHLTHTYPNMINDHLNADVGANSYRFFDKDLQALKETKV